jgi:threonine/homoserine/homoserine lactone efflux protein
MDANFLLKGILLGFAIAAPVGPIGVLCIRRTLAEGRRVGFVSGLGAATADLIYGGVAAFGLTAISSLLVAQQFWLALLGGGYLIYLGVRTFLSQSAAQVAEARRGGLWGAYLSTFFLTLTNPATILSFVAVFAGLGLGGTDGIFAGAALLVLGVFLGSAGWWLLLSAAVGLLRGRVTPAVLVWVNRVAGVVLVGFGAAAWLALV